MVEVGGQALNDGAEVHQHYARYDVPVAAAVAEPRAKSKADTNAARKVVSD
jgi:hypothetical protein